MTRWQCRRFAAALVDYAEGTLPDARCSRVARHLATCAECAATLSALREVPQALRVWPEPAQDAAILLAQRASIRVAIEAATPPHAGRLRGWLGDGWSWPAWQLPAAAVASGLLSILVLYRFVGLHKHPIVGVGSLDDATLVEVQDVTHTLSPHGEWFRPWHTNRVCCRVWPMEPPRTNRRPRSTTLPAKTCKGSATCSTR